MRRHIDAFVGKIEFVLDAARIVIGDVFGQAFGLDFVRAFERDGARIIVDRKSYLYLEWTTLDFSEGLEGKGFHFHNPQASRTCACGESFSL